MTLQNHTIKDIMKNWIMQDDYPVVQVSRNGSKLSIYQDHYYLDDNNTILQSYNNWWIPVTFTTFEQLDFTNNTVQYWITPSKGEVNVHLENNDGWIILNLQQTGKKWILQ